LSRLSALAYLNDSPIHGLTDIPLRLLPTDIAVYFVVRGATSMRIKVNMGTKDLTLINLGPGGFFGEECSVQCRQITSLLRIQKGNKVQILQPGTTMGKIATVLNPDFGGLVKVELGRAIYAYDVSELAMLDETEAEADYETELLSTELELEQVSMVSPVNRALHQRMSIVDPCLATKLRRRDSENELRRRSANKRVPRFRCSVISLEYSELLAIPCEAYIQLATDHIEILGHVNPTLGIPFPHTLCYPFFSSLSFSSCPSFPPNPPTPALPYSAILYL
jgi:hypothetical protein